MNNTPHTPAPWKVIASSIDAAAIVAPDSNDKTICWVALTDYLKRDRVVIAHQDRANVRLIAAAPELLAICEEIANDSKCDLVNSERRIRLYSALSKAKGERIK